MEKGVNSVLLISSFLKSQIRVLSNVSLFFKLIHKLLYLRVLFQQGHGNINQTWGLVVLLVSKMAGFNSAIPESELDEASGLLKTQRMLAETIETTCSGNDIHREGVLNMQNLQYAGISKKQS